MWWDLHHLTTPSENIRGHLLGRFKFINLVDVVLNKDCERIVRQFAHLKMWSWFIGHEEAAEHAKNTAIKYYYIILQALTQDFHFGWARVRGFRLLMVSSLKLSIVFVRTLTFLRCLIWMIRPDDHLLQGDRDKDDWPPGELLTRNRAADWQFISLSRQKWSICFQVNIETIKSGRNHQLYRLSCQCVPYSYSLNVKCIYSYE